MKYYTRPASPGIPLMIIAISKNGTEMVECSTDSKVSITYTNHPANRHPDFTEIDVLEYANSRKAILRNVSDIEQEVIEKTINALYPEL